MHERFEQKIGMRFSAIQIIVFYYLILTLVAFVLFYIPFFRNEEKQVDMIDMFFMAVSTTSVTGLSTFNIYRVFNERGIVLLEILFQVGGLGIMMISTFFAILSRRKISLRQRQLIMIDMNQPKLSGIVRLIKRTMLLLLAVQLVFGFIFGLYFQHIRRATSFGMNMFWGLYESVSAVTNSGFDVTGTSLIPFANHESFLLAIMFLIFIGGIGFPVLLETTEYLFICGNRTKRRAFRFSLFSKLAIMTFLGLFVIGAILIFIFERNHLYQGKTLGQSIINAMFYSITTRNAGMEITPIAYFQPNTLLVLSLLMFIGASPSSVGGGIRTTTAIIVFLYMVSFIKGEENVNIFGRQIDGKDVRKSVVVMYLSMLFCFVACLILMATQDFSMISIVVEVASAFGTTGLSMGITSQMDTIGKITLMILMFVGRVGTLYMLMLFVPKQTKDIGFSYPSEQIIIG